MCPSGLEWEIGSGKRWSLRQHNRTIPGPSHEKELAVGEYPLQLYSLAPNGVKVTIVLEKLLDQGIAQAEYGAYLIRVLEGDQFSSGFVKVTTNSKIPVLLDQSQQTPVRVFKS